MKHPNASLAGRVAIVTGAGSEFGLGRSIAHQLAHAGASIVVSDVGPDAQEGTREAEPGEGWRGTHSVVQEIRGFGGKAMAVLGDVSSSNDVEQVVQEALDHFGRIDILVNNAAAPHGEDRNWSWRVPEYAFDAVMSVNCKGVFLFSTSVTRHMLAKGTGGRIVNISSLAGRQGFPQRAAYSASKFAVIGLTQSMAQELAGSGITVNAICPGPTDTGRQRATRARLESGDEVVNSRFTVTSTPTGRLGKPKDVARAVGFLVDPAADHITGQAINVDGGFFMN